VEGECAVACATGVRCGADGSTCCSAGDVCLSEVCVTPGAPCADSYDCDEGHFCEPTLDQCLPQPSGSDLCEYRPPTLPFDAVVEWSWTGSTIKPTAKQVINMPVVIDLDQDSVPDVVIVTSETYNASDPGYLRALDGSTGLEKWDASAGVYAAGNEVNPRATPAAADIDGDGVPEIVAAASAGGAIAFRADGSLLWKSTQADGTTPWLESTQSVTVAIAHMDGDTSPEIVLGGVVLDASGRLRSGLGRALAGANVAGYGAVSIIADVNADGIQDVVTGKAAWTVDGVQIWDNGQTDGYPAISDLDGDGHPELVVVSNGQVRVQDAATGVVLATVAMPGSGKGGPPTVADFDADGVMEISSANGNAYAVFEYASQPAPALTVKWSKVTQDLSSNVTGSSVFDFEGDGAAEVVYGDECYFRVYSGQTGDVLFETASSSATIHEYPVVVDVDGDNNTEVVVVSNDRNHGTGTTTCPGYGSGEAPRHGVFVYGDANDKWVRTRRIWNQHAYHITNINAGGVLPNPELASWLPPQGFNNYRVSTQGAGVFNAPDLRVDLEVSSAACPVGLELRARVKNAGSLGVPAGVAVAFYFGNDATGTLLGEASTTKPLLPGQSEVVTQVFTIGTQVPPFAFFVTVDGAGVTGTVDECLEDNNEASAGGMECPGVK
jgi:predicted Rdx family selenoprotein